MTIVFHEPKGVVNSSLHFTWDPNMDRVDANQKPLQNPSISKRHANRAFDVLIQMTD